MIDIKAQMLAVGAVTLSIRAPRPEIDSDPRGKDFGKWSVAYKTSEFQLHWHRGPAKDTFEEALAACFKVKAPPAEIILDL